jgi:hypothetical protein
VHRDHPDQVGAAHNADQLPLVKYQYALDVAMDENMADLFYISIRCNADDTPRHDTADRFPLSSDDVVLGHDADHRVLIVDDG